VSVAYARRVSSEMTEREKDEIAAGVLALVRRVAEATGHRHCREETVVGSLAWHREIARREGLLG
jgi:hypothetical protein